MPRPRILHGQTVVDYLICIRAIIRMISALRRSSLTFAESTFATAGRTPIAVETLSDTVNVVKGEHYLLYDTSNKVAFD